MFAIEEIVAPCPPMLLRVMTLMSTSVGTGGLLRESLWGEKGVAKIARGREAGELKAGMKKYYSWCGFVRGEGVSGGLA